MGQTEQLCQKLRYSLNSAAEEIANRFGDKFSVRHFYYDGTRFPLQPLQILLSPADIFYFSKSSFKSFANDFFGMLCFPDFPLGCGRDSVQIILDSESKLVHASFFDKRYEDIVKRHLDGFAQSHIVSIDYS